ncbi:MAG: hypothetical protein KDD62_02545, partial [Bdellovibrionales bacterium]|nr:hypothetical protein [Bdellovibrionales bacterium]
MSTVKRYSGMSGPAKAWLLTKIFETQRKIIAICPDTFAAERLSEDLRLFLTSTNVLDLPAWDTLPFELVSPQVEISATRIYATHTMLTQDSFICVTTAEALCQRFLSIREIDFLTISLKPKQAMNREELLQRLQFAGYQRVSLVELVGQYT